MGLEATPRQDPRVEIFSTCPASSAVSTDVYHQKVVDVARWSERAGCTGILVYTDNNLVDPWLVSQIIIESTDALCPLVAIQPVYMHPYTVAKMVTSLGLLYQRRVHLNMVSGGFKNDLLALNDLTPHDERYARLVEYTTIIQKLLRGGPPVTLDGKFYKVSGLKLTPPLPVDLIPEVFMSGSSGSGLSAARAVDATAVRYPKPVAEEEDIPEVAAKQGIRVGIIARPTEEEAWDVAHARFPADRKGQITHQLAMKVSDSVWHQQLSDMAADASAGPYWLFPFENYKTMCPYLVGDYRRVGEELGRYVALGARTFILDVPPDEEDLRHTNEAFRMSLETASA